MDNAKIVEALVQEEQELLKRAEAARLAIIAFGGTPRGTAKRVVIASTEEPEVVKKPKAKKKGPSKKRRGGRMNEIQNYIVEILQENNKPMKAKQIHKELKELGFDWKLQSVYALIPPMAKDGWIKRHDKGLYVHNGYKGKVEPLKKKVVTIREVYQYIETRKEVRRKELVNFFVKSGMLTENQVQTRVEKLIKERKVKRKEHGTYQWCG